MKNKLFIQQPWVVPAEGTNCSAGIIFSWKIQGLRNSSDIIVKDTLSLEGTNATSGQMEFRSNALID